MRILPLVLIAVGVFGVLKHFGLIDPAFVALFWPVLLIAIGVAMLALGPRWRARMRRPGHSRWERRMHRHFGPGWAHLSEEERERFRAGMRQWHGRGVEGDAPSGPASASDGASPNGSASSAAPGEQR